MTLTKFFQRLSHSRCPDAYLGQPIWLLGYSGVIQATLPETGISITDWFFKSEDKKELFTDLDLSLLPKLPLVSMNRFVLFDLASRSILFECEIPFSHMVVALSEEEFVVSRSKANALTVIHIRSGAIRNFSFPDCHGLVRVENLLYVLGWDVLAIYEITSDHKPLLVERRRYDLPDLGGHHLALVNDRKRLLLSTSRCIYEFDLLTHRFHIFKEGEQKKKVKSIDMNRAGSLVYTAAGKHHRSISKVQFLRPRYELNLGNLSIYKARWAIERTFI